jgi:hypothetical protein
MKLQLQLLLLFASGSPFWGSGVEVQAQEGSGAAFEAGDSSGLFDEVPYPEDGQRCINKVTMEERTEWEDHITCDHSYDKRCFKSQITTYESVQEEECNDDYIKNCFLTYEQTAIDETVKICRSPLIKNCDIEGEEICRTEYESECWTKIEEHNVVDDVVECETVYEDLCEEESNGYTIEQKCTKWPKEVCSLTQKDVTKSTPITGCTKEPIVLCAPAGCKFVAGPEECHDKTQTLVQDEPKEECSLEPRRSCRHVTKLAPKLIEVEKCIDVPKEVCVSSRRNPRKIKYPVVKKWCYTYKQTLCEERCRRKCVNGVLESCKPGCEQSCDDPSCQEKCKCPPKCLTAFKEWTSGKLVQCRPDSECGNFKRDCPCECPKPCQRASKQGKFLDECIPWHDDPKCAPPCPKKCMDVYNKWTNGDLVQCRPDSECGDYKAKCPCECPKPCQEASKQGKFLDECIPWHDDPKCAPPCPKKCMDVYNKWTNGDFVQCRPDSECGDYKGNCPCECPLPCQDASKQEKFLEECIPWHNDPKCKPPCPKKCYDISESYKEGRIVKCERSCEQYSDKCPCDCPKPCEQEKSISINGGGNCADWRNQTIKEDCRPWRQEEKCGCETTCPNRCKRECKPGGRGLLQECPSGCGEYCNDPDCYPECDPYCKPECKRTCVDGKESKCAPGCDDFCDNPLCRITCGIPLECPHKCERSKVCTQPGYGEPDPTCPCTGVPECANRPGCCPTKYDFLIPSFGIPITYPDSNAKN